MNQYREHCEGYMIGVTNKGQEFLFDKEDLCTVLDFTWHMKSGGYLQTHDYSQGDKMILIHRMILKLKDPKIKVDHINGNKLDNRKSNLRTCTQKQNACNNLMRNKNTSGYKGVMFHKLTQKWQSQICVNYKKLHLGLFDDKLEAARAYNEAAIKYHGEFARLNVI